MTLRTVNEIMEMVLYPVVSLAIIAMCAVAIRSHINAQRLQQRSPANPQVAVVEQVEPGAAAAGGQQRGQNQQ